MTTGGRSAKGGLTFELANDLAEMPVLVERLEAFCEQHGIGPEVFSVVDLALEEIIINIIASGYADGGAHRIRVDLSHDGATLTARVEDDAEGFDPLGIQLVTTLMDEVVYSREQDRNVLCIRKTTL